MVNWKVALAVFVIAVLLVAIGMWFGYRYVSEQDDISPAGWREPAHKVSPPYDKPLAVLAARREKSDGALLRIPNTTEFDLGIDPIRICF